MDKYTATRIAVRDLLSDIGHRVNYGAAVFPGSDNPDGCMPGKEVFPTVGGDPLGSSQEGRLGPNLLRLAAERSHILPPRAEHRPRVRSPACARS